MPSRNNKINAAYFSATFSTKRIVGHIARQMGSIDCEIDITNEELVCETKLCHEDLLVVGVPVYAGRVPAIAVNRLKALKGENTPAVIVCVYGNRDYDDALLELSDIITENGFIPVAAAAIIAEHCIFPKVAANRPDISDWQKIDSFCEEVKAVISTFNPATHKQLLIKGNRPYKKAGGVPLYPSADKQCNMCGSCAQKCPTGAISMENPAVTDKGKCISCARCIKVCPQHARKFQGALYKSVGFVFVKACSSRKEPEFIFSE